MFASRGPDVPKQAVLLGPHRSDTVSTVSHLQFSEGVAAFRTRYTHNASTGKPRLHLFFTIRRAHGGTTTTRRRAIASKRPPNRSVLGEERRYRTVSETTNKGGRICQE